MSATDDLNHREFATLRAVARGDAEITCSCEPDLFIEGVFCCDQNTVHRLARRGLIVASRAGRSDERVPASITDAGRAALGVPTLPAAQRRADAA